MILVMKWLIMRMTLSGSQSLEDYDDLDLDYYMFKKNKDNFEAEVGESSDSHIQTPNPLSRMVEDVQLYANPKEKHHHSVTQSGELSGPLNGSEIGDDYQHELYVRSNWQVQGFLKDKAVLIEQALRVIHQKLAMILGHGGWKLQARANMAVAECHPADSTFSLSEDPDMVLESLKQAAESLEVLEFHELAAEAFYLMAVVFDQLGRLEEREEAAECFKKHITALEKPEPEELADPLGYGAQQYSSSAVEFPNSSIVDRRRF